MAEYHINGKIIEFDPSKTYLDFYWQGREGRLMQVNLEGMLEAMAEGTMVVDDKLRQSMEYLKRWETEAPWKRGLRDMRRGGAAVLTSDALFEEDGGEEIIDNLENTGVFAAYFIREMYGEK